MEQQDPKTIKLSELGLSVSQSEPVEIDFTSLYSYLPANKKLRKMKIDKTKKCCIVQLEDE